jgi:hypothetical protein
MGILPQKNYDEQEMLGIKYTQKNKKINYSKTSEKPEVQQLNERQGSQMCIKNSH